MRTRSGLFALGALVVLGALGALATGCDDSTGPGDPIESVPLTWIGTLADSESTGALTIDLVQRGESLTGDVVVTTIPEMPAVEHLLVRGTLRDGALHLELDSDRIPYQFSFTLDGELDAALLLTGSLSYPAAGLEASIACRPLARGEVTVESSFDVPYAVKAMVFDGSKLWLSTIGDDYLRMTTAGTLEDRVVVLYNDAHWTSGALTFDGSKLLGFLPTTVQGPGGTRNESAMFEFDDAGISRRYDLPHRTSGLAFDGAGTWSLEVGTRTLFRFDASGAILDSLRIDVPDPYHLEFDGTSFWTTSWYTLALYRVDMEGRTAAVYELPLESPLGFQAGIAVEGSRLWFGRSIALGETRIYRLTTD